MNATQYCITNHRSPRQALSDLIARLDGNTKPLQAMSGVPLSIPRPHPIPPPAPRSARRPRVVRRPIPCRWVKEGF